MESNANFSSVNNVLKYINEKHPVLPKYLTSDDLVDLESIILSELQNSSGVASGFREILFNFGWNGLHFRTAHGNTINLQNFVDSLTNELLNIYREGVSESGSYYSQYGSSSGKNSAKEPSISFSNKGFGRQRPHHGVGSFSASVGASSRNGAHRAPSFMERMGGGDLALDLERSREDNLTLLSYCPDILFECNSNFEEPVSVSFKGACVLIDISGFTKLSNSLCQKGSNGLDRLHSATDVYLGYFSDTVYQYGGDVIAFAGDALLCMFYDELDGPGGTKGRLSDSANNLHSSPPVLPHRKSSMTGKPGRSPSIAEGLRGLIGLEPSGNNSNSSSPVPPHRKSSMTGKPGRSPSIAEGLRGLIGLEPSGSVAPLVPSVAKKEPHEDACARAVECAFHLKDHCSQGLTVHVAVSCGQMSFGVLGGYHNKWTYLLNGSCIPQLSPCINAAGSQELIITEEVYEVVKPLVFAAYTEVEHLAPADNISMVRVKKLIFTNRIELGGDRFVHPELVDTPRKVGVAATFVAAPVLDAINMGHFHSSMSEVREVTTMFLNLDSYCTVTHANPLSLQPFYFMVQRQLEASGGFMRQFLIDDKGCVLILMWGVPSFTYGNNGYRALVCAHRIATEAQLIDHKCSIGVTTGNVFCGNVGSDARHDFVGIGHTVNLAARFMGKAKGKILVDATTRSNLKSNYKRFMVDGGKLTLKGVVLPVQCYTLIGDMSLGDLHDECASGGVKSALESVLTQHHAYGNNSVGVLCPPHVYRAIEQQMRTFDDIDRQSLLLKLHSGAKELRSYSSSKGSRSAAVSGSTHRIQRTISSISDVLSGRSGPLLDSYASLTQITTFDSILHQLNLLKYVDAKPISNVHTTILEGTGGFYEAGAKSTFSELANNACARNISVVGRLKDSNTPFGVIRKLLPLLIGSKNFRKEPLQKRILQKLLYNAYCQNQDFSIQNMEEHLVLLSAVLNLKWKGGGFEAPTPRNNYEKELLESEKDAFFRKPLVLHLLTTLVGIILVQKPTSIIIENGQFMDALSWQCIAACMNLPVNAIIFMTVRRVSSGANENALIDVQADVDAHESQDLLLPLDLITSSPDKAVRSVGFVATPGSSHNTIRNSTKGQAISPPKPKNRNSSYSVGSTSSYDTVLNASNKVSLPSQNMGETEKPRRHSLFGAIMGRSSRHNEAPRRSSLYESSVNASDRPRKGSLLGNLGQSILGLFGRKLSLVTPSSSAEITSAEEDDPSSDNTNTSHNVSITARKHRRLGFNPKVVQSYTNLLNHPSVTLVTVENMSWDEVAGYLEINLETNSVPKSVVDIVFDLSKGNLFWCANFTKFINLKGVDEFIDELEKDADSVTTLKLQTICGFDALKPAEKVLMKAASVIGEEFYREMLDPILPEGIRPQVDRMLDSLVSEGLLLCVDYNPPCFAFPSPAICTILQGILPPSESIQFHQTLAQFIEKRYCDDIVHYYRSLSYHYGFCPDCRVSAFKYDILAADQSLAKGAFTDCVVLLTHAADRVATDSEFKVLRMVLDQVALDMKPVGVKPSPLVKQPSFFNKMKKQMSGMFKLDNDSANDGYEAEEKLDLYDDCLILTEKVIEMHAKLENNTVPDEPLTWSPAYSLSKINKPGPESVAPRSVRRLNKRRSTKAAGKGGLMKLVKHMSGIFDADTDSDEE